MSGVVSQAMAVLRLACSLIGTAIAIMACVDIVIMSRSSASVAKHLRTMTGIRVVMISLMITNAAVSCGRAMKAVVDGTPGPEYGSLFAIALSVAALGLHREARRLSDQDCSQSSLIDDGGDVQPIEEIAPTGFRWNSEPKHSEERQLEYQLIWREFDSVTIGHALSKPKDVHGRVERFLSSPFVPDFVKHEFMFMLERLAQLRPTTAPHDPDASLTAAFIVDRIESITGSLCKTQAIAEGWRHVIEPEIANCERAYGKLVHVKCVHDAMPSFLHMRSSEQ